MAPQPLKPLEEAGRSLCAEPREGRRGDAEGGQGGQNGILYDLGSGDGRIVITAAKRFGTRGVGVDIDAARSGARARCRRGGCGRQGQVPPAGSVRDRHPLRPPSSPSSATGGPSAPTQALQRSEPGRRVRLARFRHGVTGPPSDAESARASGHDLLLGGPAAHRPLSASPGADPPRTVGGVAVVQPRRS